MELLPGSLLAFILFEIIVFYENDSLHVSAFTVFSAEDAVF